MPANRNQLQTALHKSYNRLLFAKEVLSPIFGTGFSLYANDVTANAQPTKSESTVIDKVAIYGNIILEDNTEITCYEILLKPNVRIEHSKVAIQQYVRKLLTVGQAALINFIPTRLDKNDIAANTWRLTFVAKDSLITDDGIKEKHTNAKRYTYLLGPSETCKTAAERFEILSTAKKIDFEALVNTFSVERLSKAFFDEYTLHYQNFIEHLTTDTKYLKTVFKGDDKTARDFVKKLMGRIVFLYFVQKKGWLGASTKEYKDGDTNFMMNLFIKSGLNETFYPNWLSPLFFETLNKERINDIAPTPLNKANLGLLPFLNGGLFDKEKHDESIITFKPSLFHNADVEDVILTEKNKKHSRGFLDFLNAFNFTVHEDSPDDSTVAVDPEMLGHIFENLLEDNKDKGTFYTPKEIVHYMCQESLTEYLITHLSKEYTVYRQLDKQQVELFGNEARTGQLLMMEQLGSKALNRADVEQIVKHKNISQLTKQQLKTVNELLTTVKICDPAIGSGAFPMGLLQEIMAIKELVHYSLNEQFSSPSPNGEGWGEAWQPATIKENIIQKSIYGVDIEKGAVDIARLRFWLSIVVDEDLPKPLPNLDYKIVVGNSLLSKFDDEIINLDWSIKHKNATDVVKIITDQQVKLHLLQSKQALYFTAVGNKAKLKKEIELLKAQVLINQLTLTKISFEHNNPKLGGFAPTAKETLKNTDNQLTLAGYNKTIKKLESFTGDEALDFFDWKLNFPDVLNEKITKDVGFDIVIGNPPYIGQKGNKELFEHFKESTRWKFFYERKQDIYYYFIVQGILLTKQEGNLTYINPPYFLTAAGGKNLREFIAKNTYIDKIVDLSETVKVFENANINSLILFLNNDINFRNSKIKILTPNIVSKTSYLVNPKLFTSKFTTEDLSGSEWHIFKDENTIEFKSNDITPLGSISTISPGIQTGCDKVTQSHLDEYHLKNTEKDEGIFVLSNEEYNNLNLSTTEKKFVKPFFKNSAISKWTYDKNNRHWIIITNNIENLNLYPNLKKHLSRFKVILDNRYRNFALINADKEDKWWYLYGYRPNTNFNDEKIVLPYRAVDNSFAYSSEPFYASIDVFFINVTNSKFQTKYINCILCSKIIEYWLNKNCKRKGKILELYQKPLSEIPIIQGSEQTQKTFSIICDYILFLKSQELATVSQQLMPTYFEQIIDGMVYELYFPELLKKHNREIIQHLGELPIFTDTMSEDKKMSICTQVFNRLNQKEHPVRVNLFYMNSIPEIAIIEGKQ